MDKLSAMAGLARDPAASGYDAAIVREAARRYDRCHPGDTFADLVHRSSFSKEDRRLMEDWLAATAARRRRGNA